MKKFLLGAFMLCLCVFPKINFAAYPPNLGAAANFLLFTPIGAISNTGTSTITGDIGNNVGVISGFGPPTIFNGTAYTAQVVTWQAEYDISLALGQLTTQAYTNLLPGTIGGGLTIGPGVYSFVGACTIADTLILDAGGDINAVFIFQVNGALTSNAASVVILKNGARAGNVFWAVSGAASFGANSYFSGTAIAKGAIGFGAGTNFKGRALSTVGAIAVNTLIGTIPNGPSITTVQPGCTGNVGSVTINAPTGAGYTYSLGGPFQSSPIFTGLAPGTYYITVKDNLGVIISTGVSTVIYPQYEPSPFNLGVAGKFVLFTSSGAVSNTSTSYVTGDIGTNLGAISGMGLPTIVTGVSHTNDSVTAQAKLDLAAAFILLKNLIPTGPFPAAPVNGQVFTEGVYNIAGASSIAGNLILDGGGNPNAVFVFQIGGAFSLGAGASIILTNGASANRVFWVVTGAAAMAANTTITGTIVNDAAISFGDGTILNGRALSTLGAVSIYGTLVYSPFQCYSLLPPFVSLRLKVLLEGATYNNPNPLIMRDNLRNSPFTGLSYLPKTDPYTNNADYTGKYTAVGDGLSSSLQTVLDSATMFANHFNNTNIVDWVFIELRDKTNPATVLATRSALVTKEGSVVDIDGSNCIRFPSLASGDYYVSVRHRNHLGVMTATALPASTFDCSTAVDFTTMTNEQLYNKLGYNGLEMQTVTDGVTSRKALWACDADGNRKIKYTAPDDDAFKIFVDLLLHNNNTGFDYNYDFGFGYWAGDLDMNSKVKYTAPNDDQFLLFVQLLLYPLNTAFDYNYDFFNEQLP